MKKVYKYATGQEIPEGAVYLSTQVEKVTYVFEARFYEGEKSPERRVEKNELVWHYFLVEVK